MIFIFGGFQQTLLIVTLGFDDLSTHTVKDKIVFVRSGIKVGGGAGSNDTLDGFLIEVVVFAKVGNQHVHAFFELLQYGLFTKSFQSAASGNDL
jgi:hypothetical protein